MKKKKNNNAMLVAAGISLMLAIIKGVMFGISGSMIVLLSVLDSLSDSIVSLLNHKVHQLSREDADAEHPFGHGGYEVIASLIQGVVLLFFGVNIVLAAVRSMFSDDASTIEPATIPLAAGVMFLSAMGGYFIQRFLNRRIVDQDHREDRSLTMMADHAHYSGDVAMNLAGVIALVAIWYTGLTILDPILAIFGALFLIKAAYPTLKQCYFDIVHVRIDPNMQQEIVDIIFASDIRVQGIHQLRSRELGPNLFIDFHMVLDRNITLEEAHDISDQVEESIKRKFTRADIVIHLDPDSEFDHEFWEPQYSTDKFHSRSKSTTPI